MTPQQKRVILFSGGVNPSPIPALVAAYQARVLADAGNVDETTNNLTALLNQLNGVVPNFTNTCKLAAAPHWGNKTAAGTGGTAGNRAANKIYNIFGASGDLVQATAASQPLLLRNTSVNYGYLPGISGNYFSTPSAVVNEFTTDFSFEARINVRDITATSVIIAKDGGGAATRQFQFRLASSRLQLVIDHSSGTQIIYQSTVNIPFSNNQIVWVRCSRVQSTGIIQFFTSTDGVTYTQLGTNVSGVTNTLSNPTRIIEIGSILTGIAGNFNGEIYYVNGYKDSTFTTPTLIFNPQLYNRSVSQTTFTSGGAVYTINVGSATTGLKAMIPDKGLVVGNGTSYGMQAPSFNLNAGSFTSYKVYRKFNNTIVSIPFELSADAESNSGFYEAVNGVANCDAVGAFGNVGFNSTVFNSNNLLMKVSTFDWDSSRANPESLYYVNNVAATVNSAGGTANNTGNMNGTGYNWLARNNAASLWTNGVVFADLIFEGVHDTATRTNVFNILKTYFNLP